MNGIACQTSVWVAPGSLAELEVCPLDELPPGSVKIIRSGELAIGVYNVDGELFAIEDRCSHDDGPLCEGDWDPEELVVTCPRHGSNFDLRSGEALTLPAYLPVETFPVRVDDGFVKIKVS